MVSTSSEATGWTAGAYAYALLVAGVLGYFLLGVPIQLTDSFGNLVQVGDGTLGSLVYNQLYQRSYLRPLLWGHLRVVYDLSGGAYFEWFRGWHVAQVVLLVVLFVRLLAPRTAADGAAVPLGLAALIGVHTFAGTVREAFPVNTFMTIVLCCLAAADLALGAPRWWRTLLACVVFVFAAFTLESGLLVAVVLAAAYAAGARGVSARGLAAVIALLAGYLWLRFFYLDVGSPDLLERSSGYGFGSLEPDQLVARFGDNPLPFYAYNVLASVLSLLAGEPRGGTFLFTRDLLAGEPRPRQVIGVVACLSATALIAAYGWTRRGEWRARRFDRGDQLVLVFVAVALANAAISYAYTKDVIMSPAGTFFALALAVAARTAMAVRPASRTGALLVTVLLVAGSAAWALRSAGIHVALRHSGLVMRNEWAYADHWFAREREEPLTAREKGLKEYLQEQAIVVHPAPPTFIGDWLEWFEE